MLRVYYDGACPLCSREMAWLMRRIPEGAIEYVDIASPSFDEVREGRPREILMKEIHAKDERGSWFTGMEVFRRLYSLAGLGWLLAPTGWPVLRPTFDHFYRVFARNRLRVTGRK